MNYSIDFKRFNNHNISTLFLFFLLKKKKPSYTAFPLLHHLLLMMPLILLLPRATILLTVQRSIIQSLLKTGIPSHFVDFWLYYCAHTLIKIRDKGKHFCCVVGRNDLILWHFYFFFCKQNTLLSTLLTVYFI